MKINLAKSAGFCFGVKRALSIAFETLKTAKNIEMLGDLVHNEDVVTMVKEAGIKKIHRLRNGKNKTLLIRAHGTCNTTLANAKKMGYKIIDATCPMVKEIHTIGCDMEKKGYKIIIIGDKKHDEVRGIIGQLKYKPIVISKFKDLKSPAIRHLKKAAIISQSTQELSKVLKMIHSLKHVIPELKFFNTICQPTRSKQREIKKMPTKNDTMIIIGSKTSANTKR
ncbi:MAG: 4-hydroxy-3-methylbut-2-enyl diphosphate reductase, partial [Candidatus Omnitrophota bacterium]